MLPLATRQPMDLALLMPGHEPGRRARAQGELEHRRRRIHQRLGAAGRRRVEQGRQHRRAAAGLPAVGHPGVQGVPRASRPRSTAGRPAARCRWRPRAAPTSSTAKGSSSTGNKALNAIRIRSRRGRRAAQAELQPASVRRRDRRRRSSRTRSTSSRRRKGSRTICTTTVFVTAAAVLRQHERHVSEPGIQPHVVHARRRAARRRSSRSSCATRGRSPTSRARAARRHRRRPGSRAPAASSRSATRGPGRTRGCCRRAC